MLGILWLAIAGLTATVAVVEPLDSALANALRVAIVVLMVITAFLLIRYDLRRRDDE